MIIKLCIDTQNNLLRAPVLKHLVNSYLKGACIQDMGKRTRPDGEGHTWKRPKGGASGMHISASIRLSTQDGYCVWLPQL